MSDIHDRIAAVLRREFRIKQGIPNGEYFPSEVFDHVADVLVRELGLTQETRLMDDGMSGMSTNWQFGPVTTCGRPQTSQVRYVTAWEAE